MKFSTVLYCFWLCICSGVYAQTTISADDLQKDFDILQKTLESLHPGLYRYEDKATIEGYFNSFQQKLQSDKTLPETYKLFSQFITQLKCGHTYLNYWNQKDATKKEIFYTSNKIPFAFRLVGERMIVVKDATPAKQLPKGTEILAINGVSVPVIIDSLLTIAKTDGSNIGSQLNHIQLSGLGEYEAFDIYFSLFFPPQDGRYDVKLMNIKTQEKSEVNLAAMSRAQRLEVIEARYGTQAGNYDDLWKFEILDEETAYLKLGTFVTWKMELNWKKFLKEAFTQVKAKNIPNLIIDIRGNGGGTTDVVRVVAKNLLTKDVALEGTRSVLAYEKVPEELNPYLSTWSNAFRDRTGKVKPIGNGQYTFKNEDEFGKTYKANSKAYRGKTYLIVDPSNSSATFFMAKYFKKSGLATLVGQQTGGNRKGTNGGNLFFLNLPNTKIEIDIPLIADFPLTEQPDEGILPDVEVLPSVEDVINGVDTEVEAIRKMIGGNASDRGEAKTNSTTSNELNSEVLKVLEGKWKGKLTYLNYGDDKTLVDIPCTFEANCTNTGLNTLVTYEEKNKNGKPMTAKNIFKIQKGGKVLQLNSEWQVTEWSKDVNRLLIKGIRKGKDNDRKSDFRLTLEVVDGKVASWKKEVRYKGTKEFFMRNVFRFEKEN